MKNLSAYDRERLKHINQIMDEINDKVSEIYEGLMDRDYKQVDESANSMIEIIIEIKKSVRDEI